MKAIIPAAGLGTRFLPWTKACPKEMLPLQDKPIIQWTIEQAMTGDVREFIIVISKGKEAIVNYFSPDTFLDLYLQSKHKQKELASLYDLLKQAEINFVYQKGPYGNATPVLSARSLISAGEPFMIMWGDEFIFSRPPWIKQIMEVYEQHHLSVISGLEIPSSLVSQKGIGLLKPYLNGLWQVQDIIEKPDPINAPSNIALTGAYILTPDFWPFLEKLKPGKDGELWLVDAIREFVKQRTVLAKVIKNGTFFDVGTKEGYYKAWEKLKAKS